MKDGQDLHFGADKDRTEDAWEPGNRVPAS